MTKHRNLRYGVEDRPPMIVTLTSALQHLVMSMGGPLSIGVILSDLICAGRDDPIRSKLFSTTMFMLGLGTVVNCALGIRLPIFQGPTQTFLVPLLALRSTGDWTCPSGDNSGQNTTDNTTIGQTAGNIQHERLAELQGSLMLASMFEVIAGSTGFIGVLMRFVGPITMSVTITMIGLGLYEISIYFFRSHWGISGFSTVLLILFSIYLDHIRIPLPKFGKKNRHQRHMFPLFQTFPVLLSIAGTWILCGILTVCGALSNDPDSLEYKARTDTKYRILEETPWFYFPYPGQFGMPKFNTAVFVGFLVAVINSAFESIGDYHATAKACHVAPPPHHALNRGILVEGIMSVLSGAVGAGHATTSYSHHVAVFSLTKIASRLVLIVAGIMAIIVAIFGKLGAAFSLAPDPALAGVAFVGLGMVTSLGISTLRRVDLNSSRNLAVIGVSIYSGIVFPEWVKQYPNEINTGNIQVDQVIKVLIGTPMFLGCIVALFLDNTVKGTLHERGMFTQEPREQKYRCNSVVDGDIEINIFVNHDTDKEESNDRVYNLPGVHYLQSKFKIFRHLPFLQPYKYKSSQIDD